jgi:hypothetical protein
MVLNSGRHGRTRLAGANNDDAATGRGGKMRRYATSRIGGGNRGLKERHQELPLVHLSSFACLEGAKPITILNEGGNLP